MNPEVDLALIERQACILVCAILAMVVVPLAVRWLARVAPRILAWVAGACPWLMWRPFDPVVAAWRAFRRWCNPAAESRRELGRYLRSLPPHSGLTAYEEMALDIEGLPPGPARAAMREYFKKVEPPSARVIHRARRMRGRPRVSQAVLSSLLLGHEPRMISYGDRAAIAAARKEVAA